MADDDHPGNTTESEPSRRERVASSVRGFSSVLRSFSSAVGSATQSGKTGVVNAVRWRRLFVTLFGVGAVAGIFTALWNIAGPVDTIVYTVLFLVGAAGLPTTILLFGPSFPSSMKKIVGALNFILTQLAFGHGYLVEFDDRYEMCPGTADSVYILGEWHDLDSDSLQNKTVLGWQPFGLVRYKDDGALANARVESDVMKAKNVDELKELNLNGAVTDGGKSAATRAGYGEVPITRKDGLSDDSWLVDLKRVYSRGIKQIGDIMVIEKAEEVAMREEAKEGTFSGMEPVIGSIVGLFLGIITGYVMVGGA